MPKLKHPVADKIIDVNEERAEKLRRRGYKDVEEPVHEVLASASGPIAPQSEAPTKSATRKEWDAYAEAQGVDPSEYSSKDELIEALS